MQTLVAGAGASCSVSRCENVQTNVGAYPPFLCNGGFPCVSFQNIMHKEFKKMENWKIGGLPPLFFPYTAGGDVHAEGVRVWPRSGARWIELTRKAEAALAVIRRVLP